MTDVIVNTVDWPIDATMPMPELNVIAQIQEQIAFTRRHGYEPSEIFLTVEDWDAITARYGSGPYRRLPDSEVHRSIYGVPVQLSNHVQKGCPRVLSMRLERH